jgi:phosphoenolpyruvate-protein kinase (PTS system EI component)
MTGSDRYRGQPVSEGIAAGEIYHGDPSAADSATASGGRFASAPAAGGPGGTVPNGAAVPPAGGTPDSVAGGAAHPATGTAARNGGRLEAAEDAVRAAFAAVARDRAALAADLRARGQDEQAAIVDIAALIAADPSLIAAALDAVRAGAASADAISQAGEAQAALLAALPDPDLAQRAGDVRQVAKAAADFVTGAEAAPPPAGKFILVRREVEAADLIRLADAGLVGAVSIGGGASSHAAIIARGLGLPMIAGTDPAVLGAATGQQAVLDAHAGQLIVSPDSTELAAAVSAAPIAAGEAGAVTAAPANMAAPAGTSASACAAAASSASALPVPRVPHVTRAASAGGLMDGQVKTADGQPVTLLCNVASAAETRLGLSGGAAGVGLLRTEIAFTAAAGWPSLHDHLSQLTPILGLLSDRPAVVRLLDFTGDKVPPFLASRPVQGLDALLNDDGALRAQLTAILRAGRGARVSVLVPMVRSLEEVAAVRAALTAAAAAEGVAAPTLGIMVEVAATAANAAAFAQAADFFSIGTNDLTSDVLGLDRAGQAVTPALAADSRVLTLIRHVAKAAGADGIPVSVCGDAAADSLVLPLLLGAGIRTLSVGAARVPSVARQIADTDTAAAKAQAEEVIG